MEHKGVAGIFECLMEHEVTKTAATFKWNGQKIRPDTWNQILAFFRWTQDTEKSEAQVRLFVHPQLGWLAWAFPQTGGTGMTSKEVENEAATKQRAEIIPAGCIAFGTVHHHCTASAFQSGTDEQDEKRVDGLHITVGNLDDEKYSIHCRLYVKGNKFEPNMAAFWEIGDLMRQKIEVVDELGLETGEIADKMARRQMCVPPPADCGFNKLWEANYIVSRPAISTVGQTSVSGLHDYSYGGGFDQDWQKQSRKERRRTRYSKTYSPQGKKTAGEVLEEVETRGIMLNVASADVCTVISELGDGNMSELIQAVMEECFKNELSLEDLYLEMMEEQTRADMEEDKSKLLNGSDTHKQIGWDGYGE